VAPVGTQARPARALVIGYGLSGRAAAGWLAGRGYEVVILEDDRVAAERAREAVVGAGLAIEVAPSPAEAAAAARSSSLVVPSPGVRADHPAIAGAIAAGVEVVSEVELAWRVLDQLRQEGSPGRHGTSGGDHRDGGPINDRWPKVVAITGTNGKTTVTELVAAMLECSGQNAVAAGNVGYPLLEAVGHLGPGQATVLVAEVSSFQLEFTRQFRPDVSCWLNFAPDHLDWHPDLDHYAKAKAKIWARQRGGSTAVVNADDPIVQRAAAESVPAGVEVITFGSSRAKVAENVVVERGAVPTPDWLVRQDGIKGPRGVFLPAAGLVRAFPHDLLNTAAALAVALAAGANEAGCREAAGKTPVPPHRVQLVAEKDGVSWYDDSKATTPAAVHAGVQSFSSVVLIAGGRNKGLDLSALASTVPPVRAVVAVGESAPEVAEAFAGRAPVRRAESMGAAVETAASLALPGDVVVLSPGCASFDWYSSYVERGDDFSALVKGKLHLAAQAVVSPAVPSATVAPLEVGRP
jgi:UDP-N-acetylmuramoylalanine--D-glutamate ligase